MRASPFATVVYITVLPITTPSITVLISWVFRERYIDARKTQLD